MLATEHALTGMAKSSIAHAQLRLGDVNDARMTLEGVTERELELGEARTAVAALRLAENDRRPRPMLSHHPGWDRTGHSHRGR